MYEVIVVRKVFTSFSAISDMHFETCQQMCAVLSEISQLLLAFNTIPVELDVCVSVLYMKLFWVFPNRRLSRRNHTMSTASPPNKSNVPFKDRLKWCPVITFSATFTQNIELSVHKKYLLSSTTLQVLAQTTQEKCSSYEGLRARVV